MGAYQLQYNPFLNASMQPSLGTAISMSPHDQRMLTGFQPYNTLMVPAFYNVCFYHFQNSMALKFSTFPQGHPTNHMDIYSQQNNSTPIYPQQQTIGTSPSTMMAQQNHAFLQQNNSTPIYSQQQTIGPSSSTMMARQNQAFFDQLKPN